MEQDSWEVHGDTEDKLEALIEYKQSQKDHVGYPTPSQIGVV